MLRFLGVSRITRFSVGVVIFFFAVGAFIYVFGQLVLPFNPFQTNVSQVLAPPSLTHPFGTDLVGSDIFRQTLYAIPIDLIIPLTVVVVSLVVGGAIGALAAYRGGLIDELLMRITDIFRAFPALMLALAIAAALGASAQNAMLALMVVWWPTYARLARGEALVLKNKEYIRFARVAGVSPFRLITRHITPNVIPILIAYATVDVGYVLVFFSVLGYLGLGAQAPTPEWGRMVFSGQDFLQVAPWYPLFPAFMIFIVVMACSLVGDGMRDLLDPRMRQTAMPST